VVTNLPYGDLEELAEVRVKLGTRDRRNVAVLVGAEWPDRKGSAQSDPPASVVPRRSHADLSAAVGSAGAGDGFASAPLRW
jgi:hypothetical protein